MNGREKVSVDSVPNVAIYKLLQSLKKNVQELPLVSIYIAWQYKKGLSQSVNKHWLELCCKKYAWSRKRLENENYILLNA